MIALLARMARQTAAVSLFLIFALIMPVFANDDTSASAAVTKPTVGGMGLTVSVANGIAVTQPLQTGGYFNKLGSADTFFAKTDTSSFFYIRRVDTTYSDTLALTNENVGVTNPTTDTTRKVLEGDTATYILSVSNLGNVTDSIGFVIDTVAVNGYAGLDTMPNWSVLFFDSRGIQLGRIYTRGRDTVFLKLAPYKSDTFMVKAYADSGAEADTSWINFRLQSFVGNGKSDTKFVVRSYRGFNGDTFGGDGHDSITLFAELKPATALRVSKTDTVFAPVSLGGGAFSLSDTQHRVPGAMVVHTIWFDNDDSATVDTQVVIEDWIDTRYVRFDSAGLRAFANNTKQLSAAETYISNYYGNIFVDSGMPTNAAGAGVSFDVRVEYYTTSTARAALTPSVSPNVVGRIRWTITRNGTVKALVGATNGDVTGTIDAAPLGIGAARDSDMGYVRYAVVIRSDSVTLTGPGWPDSGQLVGGDPFRVPFVGFADPATDSAHLEPDTKGPTFQTAFGGGFIAEYLPNLDIVPETQFAQKAAQSGGDTVYFAHQIGNHGNAADSVTLTGTAALTGVGITNVTFFRDIGSVGAFDGIEPKIETITIGGKFNEDTYNILVAVFVPNGYTGYKDTAFITVRSRNVAFYDTAYDLFTIFGASQVVPDTAAPVILGLGDTLTFTLYLNVPCTEDTVYITIGTQDSAVVFIDSGCNAFLLTQGETITFEETTGILTVTFLNLPPSDTYTWTIQILEVDSGGVIDTTFIDSGTFIVDTIPPFFTGTAAQVIVADTTLTGSETAVTIRLTIPAVGDTNTGLDSYVVIIRDTAGKIVATDTVDAYGIYTFPFDTAGIFTVEVIAIDQAGNTVAFALGDSLAVVVPVRRTIDIVAKDKFDVLQTDDVAKGLTAQGCVTVSDPTANKNTAGIDQISVTITSDIDPIGIPLTLTENAVNSGVFVECLGFTNGVSNASAKKIKVKHGSVITATYDADGTGFIPSIADEITWQGLVVTGLDNVRTWPNPFNSISDPELIFHNLPADQSMTIEIYNLNGEKIRTLRVGDGIEFSANQNVGRWDARNNRGQLVASGTYVYMVRSIQGTKVAKMTIVH